MWIMSQNRKKLIKADCLYLTNNLKNISCTSGTEWQVEVGNFETEEQSQIVLEWLCKCIEEGYKTATIPTVEQLKSILKEREGKDHANTQTDGN